MATKQHNRAGVLSSAVTGLLLCLLISPALGEGELAHLKNQYLECTRRAYLVEAARPQFSSDRNPDDAAERVLFACRTEEEAWSSADALARQMIFSGDPEFIERLRMQAVEFKLQVKKTVVRWFTDLNAKAPRRP